MSWKSLIPSPSPLCCHGCPHGCPAMGTWRDPLLPGLRLLTAPYSSSQPLTALHGPPMPLSAPHSSSQPLTVSHSLSWPLTASHGLSMPLTALHCPSWPLTAPGTGLLPRRRGRALLVLLLFRALHSDEQRKAETEPFPSVSLGVNAEAEALCRRWPECEHPCSPGNLFQ